MSADPARSALIDPILTESPGRTGPARHAHVRALLALGVVVAGLGVTFATSASAATTTPAASAAPDTTEPDEGTVAEPVVVTIIPPAPSEPAMPAPVIRAESIVRPTVAEGATVAPRTRSFVPWATAQATTKAPPRLPETGSTTGPLVLGGAGLVGLGVVALACGRRTGLTVSPAPSASRGPARR